jgi:hypothetical protein
METKELEIIQLTFMAVPPFDNMNKKGFMTLYAVILLGSVAIALVFALSMDSVLQIKGTRDNNNSNKIKALSNSCIEIALETIREDKNYTGTMDVNIDGELCSFTVSNTGGDGRIITASGTIEDVTRKVEVTTDAFNPLNVVSWQEVE